MTIQMTDVLADQNLTLDAAHAAYRAAPSEWNAEILWAIANEYKDDDILSAESCDAIWEEIRCNGSYA